MFEADGIESDEEVRGLPKRVCCFRGGVPEAFPPVIFFCLFLCFEWLTHPHMIHRKSGMSSCSISIRVSGFFLLLFCACFVPEMLYMPRLSHEHDRMACERRAARSDASHEQVRRTGERRGSVSD